MRAFSTIAAFLFFLIINIAVEGQVTNIMVNGSSSNFTMTSGDLISWSYKVPGGASTRILIWYDANGNGMIDAGDVLFLSTLQTDGDYSGNNGPPDMDSTSGAVSFSTKIGIAPGKYIMEFTENNKSVTVTGAVNPLPSPSYSISGNVTPPAGKSAANIVVGVKRNENYQPNEWFGITDASGNYTIEMNSDTAGNPWRVQLALNPYPPNIISPQEDSVNISGNITGVNFSFIAASAQIAGSLKDEAGNLIPNADVNIVAGNLNNPMSRDVKTDINGVYQIGLTASDLSQDVNGWQISAHSEGNSGITGSKLDGWAYVQALAPGDSVARNMTIYNVNSTISGTVTLNGLAPGFPIKLTATNKDSAGSSTYSDGSTGNFTFSVSTKVYNYQIEYISSQPWAINNVIVHPGETGVKVLLTNSQTAVEQLPGNLPTQFSLDQNYPNPFNPSTIIKYQIPNSNYVTLKVYDILGREVCDLVNERQNAGYYSVEFDADKLSSGIYFYRLESGNYVSVKKLLLLK